MGIGISNKVQVAYQYQTEAGVIRQRYSDSAKSDALSLPGKTNQRDVLEISANNKFHYYCDYDGYANIAEYADSFRESIMYRIEHTIYYYAGWFNAEVGKDLREIKEEKGYYNGSDMLNACGYTYARFYAEIEDRYENGGGQWFDVAGRPLTKEKEIEELNKAYEGQVAWAASCAESAAWCQRMREQSAQAQNFDKPVQEVPETRQKDLEEMKRAFYEARDRYMELYKECKQTGNPLTRQGYIFAHNALLSLLAKTWSEDTYRR